ncbi:MAG: DUF2652 domain-containing protein [Rhodothermales bacterium]|nr:DUF2652 domain-containing protein [Rhodothermales bacterium]
MADQTSPAQPTLLFIPDISGFTNFVNDTEIGHSQHIIAELLEALVDANDIGLTVSSFEGDAILFYRNGAAPTAAELLAQVQKMYVRFHSHLKVFDAYRICHCGACSSASSLRIKFVAHFGEVGRSAIKDHATLFGREVIVAHRLMKNDVPDDEYILITKDLHDAFSNWVSVEQVAWYQPEMISAEYDFGPIDYSYILLHPLHDHVPEPTIEDFGLGAATSNLGGASITIGAPLDTVFNVVSDLSIRHEWLVGLKGSDSLNSAITRNGSTHRCVIKGKASDPFIVSHSFESRSDSVAFTETDHRSGVETVFLLKRIDGMSTSIDLEYFLKKNVLKEFIFKVVFKRKLLGNTNESLRNLADYCESLVAEGREHPAQIVLDA